MSKKKTVPHLALFVKMVTDFAEQNGYPTPALSFDEKVNTATAVINRGAFLQTFRFCYDKSLGKGHQNKAGGLGIGTWAQYLTGLMWLDSVRVLYTFGDDETYYCLHDIFNVFDIKDFRGYEQNSVFSDKTMKKALENLFSAALKYDGYVNKIAESAELREKLLANLQEDIDAVLPRWKKIGKTLPQQRVILDSVLEENTYSDIYGYNKMLYHALPHRALEKLYNADEKSRLTVFEKRFMDELEENLDDYKVKKQSDFAVAQAVCVPVKVVTSVLLVPLVALLTVFLIKLVQKWLFGDALAFFGDEFFVVPGLMAITGYVLGWLVWPAFIKLSCIGNNEKQKNAADYAKHYMGSKCYRTVACIMVPLFVAVCASLCFSGVLHSAVLGEEYVEQIQPFSSEPVKYEYADCSFYLVSSVYDEEDKAADDGSKEVVLKIKDEYYITDWLYPEEYEKYINHIQKNLSPVQQKNNLDEVDKVFSNG